MRIDTKQTLKDYEGNDIEVEEKNREGEIVKKTYTLRDAISTSINGQLKDELLTAEQKTKIYGISNKLYLNNEIDLTVDDRAFIKERAGKIMSSLIYGRLCDVFEEKKEAEPVQQG